MEPIVNPLWFYLINTFDGLRNFFFVTGGIGAVVIAIIAIAELMVWGDSGGYNEKEVNSFKNRIKKYKSVFILSLAFIFIGVLLPNEKTCYEMIAAQIITPDNLNVAGDAAKSVVDYVVQSAEAIIEAIKK